MTNKRQDNDSYLPQARGSKSVHVCRHYRTLQCHPSSVAHVLITRHGHIAIHVPVLSVVGPSSRL